jgi:anthranilate synthase/aminodeoxychorismate synthase-like glutamine amidotransferase
VKVLVIDNYDSFTYNLVQYLGELGAELTVVRNDELTVEQALALQPDRIVISPGPCTPHEAGISIPLIQAAAGKVPILGVCLGHQAIGAAFGGQHRPRDAPHARQGVARAPHEYRRLSRHAQPAARHPLPLAGD